MALVLTEPNAPVTIYDTSGPYTDPDADIDVKQGLTKAERKMDHRQAGCGTTGSDLF